MNTKRKEVYVQVGMTKSRRIRVRKLAKNGGFDSIKAYINSLIDADDRRAGVSQ